LNYIKIIEVLQKYKQYSKKKPDYWSEGEGLKPQNQLLGTLLIINTTTVITTTSILIPRLPNP
jgi:hypothetical protein